MILGFGTRFHQCPRNVISSSTRTSNSRFSIKSVIASLQKMGFSHGDVYYVGLSFIQVKEHNVTDGCKKMDWSLRSSADGAGFDRPTGSGDGRTRLLKAIRTFQLGLTARFRALRKDLPKKFLFFLVGFYCATAFATVIGQTGDWDILSAGVAVAVVEAIGALMYKSSVPLLDRSKNIIILFNYWKAGLVLGLFLDSFKY
ncbi:ycf20-like protein [Amaranthus tricolor]|uniref:ycf20-like protein n=1 Tax=Amaranthus tricolor TaxID=29722 RepID=UPI00258D81F8|nr:ycf20-like protein [Amaranthus tricolor]